MSKFLMALGLMAVMSSANAGGLCFIFCIKDPKPPVYTPTAKAPELDPASAMAGLTLLAGGLAVVRGRRFKK
jgi:hypothetical protein